MRVFKTSTIMWFAIGLMCLLTAIVSFGAGGHVEMRMAACEAVGKSVNKLVDFTITGCQIQVDNGTWMGMQEYIDIEVIRQKEFIKKANEALDIMEKEIERRKFMTEHEMVAV